MLDSKSLDELIAHKAIEFADQIKKAAAMADKEEEIRIEVEKQLAFIQNCTFRENLRESGRLNTVHWSAT